MDEDDGDPVDRAGLLDPCPRAARVHESARQAELGRHVLRLAVGLLGEGDQEGNHEERGEDDEEGDPQAARPAPAPDGSRFDGVGHVPWLGSRWTADGHAGQPTVRAGSGDSSGPAAAVEPHS